MARNVEIKARVDDPAALSERVTGLGDFIELEVVLAEGESEQDAVLAARALMQALEIGCDQCVDCAYIDLLAHGAER